MSGSLADIIRVLTCERFTGKRQTNIKAIYLYFIRERPAPGFEIDNRSVLRLVLLCKRSLVFYPCKLLEVPPWHGSRMQCDTIFIFSVQRN